MSFCRCATVAIICWVNFIHDFLSLPVCAFRSHTHTHTSLILHHRCSHASSVVFDVVGKLIKKEPKTRRELEGKKRC